MVTLQFPVPFVMSILQSTSYVNLSLLKDRLTFTFPPLTLPGTETVPVNVSVKELYNNYAKDLPYIAGYDSYLGENSNFFPPKI